VKKLNLPLDRDTALTLQAGEEVLLSGEILTGRDQACKRLHQLLRKGAPLPVEISGQLIYFVGPSPAKPGEVIGSAGPTTSGRMNAYMPDLLAHGVRGFLGKGYLADSVKAALREHGGVYFGAIGGTGALLSQSIVACEVVAFPELLSEAVHRMRFADFPAIVLNDMHGGDLYTQALKGKL
jgi:fumarate hydratase subunit beta